MQIYFLLFELGWAGRKFFSDLSDGSILHQKMASVDKRSRWKVTSKSEVLGSGVFSFQAFQQHVCQGPSFAPFAGPGTLKLLGVSRDTGIRCCAPKLSG